MVPTLHAIALVNYTLQTVNGVKKESLLDHIYVDDVVIVKDIKSIEPTFGDHLLVLADLEIFNNVETKSIRKRDWHNYSKESLKSNLVIRRDILKEANP